MRQALLSTMLVLAVAVLGNLGRVQAQEASKPAAGQGNAAKSPVRPLAPGVETTIPVLRDTDETVSRHDIVDLLKGVPDLAWKPNYTSETRTLAELAKNVPFRRTIWNLEFTFKPLRMIEVDVPQASGKMERKVIWYMVYRVKNNGGQLRPVQREADEVVTLGAEVGAAQTTIPKGTWNVQLTDKVVLPIDPSQTERKGAEVHATVRAGKHGVEDAQGLYGPHHSGGGAGDSAARAYFVRS